jgi:hypothetical protein
MDSQLVYRISLQDQRLLPRLKKLYINVRKMLRKTSKRLNSEF